jgi:hypothetical protein
MATIVLNPDGSLSLSLTPDEHDTIAGLPVGQLDAYVTLWLEERGKTVLHDRFTKLTSQDKAAIMVTLKLTDSAKVDVVL